MTFSSDKRLNCIMFSAFMIALTSLTILCFIPFEINNENSEFLNSEDSQFLQFCSKYQKSYNNASEYEKRK